MTSLVRFLERPERALLLIVVAIWLFEAGCGSSGTKAPDAAGVDAAPDVAVMDAAQDNASSDGAPADVASDGEGADVTNPADGGGADSTDGGNDPCNPPCRARLYGGCAPEGTCVYSPGNYCYSNGVIATSSPPGGTTRQTLTKNGVVCATLDATNVWRDPNGARLGTVSVNADGSATLNCTGEAPQTVPASCTIGCSAGTCPP